MNTETQKPTLTICAENAANTLNWIRTRGGVAQWRSINLSNLGVNWHTPAVIAVKDLSFPGCLDSLETMCPKCFERIETANKIQSPAGDYLCSKCLADIKADDLVVAYPKPSWQADSKPVHIFKDPRDVIVSFDKEVKRFRVALRMGSQGTMIKLTDASSRRVRKEVEKAGEGAYHVFDYGTQECVIMAPEKTMTLEDWAKEQKA